VAPEAGKAARGLALDQRLQRRVDERRLLFNSGVLLRVRQQLVIQCKRGTHPYLLSRTEYDIIRCAFQCLGSIFAA
jgi:hypothetical protein